jgi:hypothetical protein
MTMTPLLALIALLAIWCGACAALGYTAGAWLCDGE